jgi:hypothetical protein
MVTVPPKVLIRYSHDSVEHDQRVLKLAERLRKDGVDAQIGRLDAGTPSEGWHRWIRNRISWATFVLVVASKKHELHFFDREPEDGSGITYRLFSDQRHTNKFVTVVFAREDAQFIPAALRAESLSYLLSSEDNYYASLYGHLTGRSPIVQGGPALLERQMMGLEDEWRPEPERFTDLTLYKGYAYPGDEPATTNQLLDSESLRACGKYTLKVAICAERSGIGAGSVFAAVLNPRKTTETLKLFIVAKTVYGPIEIKDHVVAVEWPSHADSYPAFFRIAIPATLSEPVLRAMIEIRLYHATLDLLDVVHLEAYVAANTETKTFPMRVEWPRLSPHSTPQLDPDAVVRELTIRVWSVMDGYKFEFIFQRGEPGIPFPFERNLKVGDLEVLLAKVRDFWTRLVITSYASQISVRPPTWKRYLRELFEMGTTAWDLLFGSRTGSQEGASEAVGQLMALTRLADGSHVQITYENGLRDFIFPWSILCPPADHVDPLSFWGAKYQLEQVWGGASRDFLQLEPVGVSVAVDPGFGEAQPEVDMFESFRAQAGDRLRLDPLIANRDDLFTALSGSRHLYYFFCHGYAPAGPSLTRRDGINVLRKSIEALPNTHRQPWETLLALTAKMADEPWVFLGNAQITESAFRRERHYFNVRRPILFLNMCHSAALAPSITSGLVRLFLDRDAAAIIGTESPMTPTFAHAFANELLNNLFSGDDVGKALWRSRRHFLHIRNPLGLVYTLYGRATIKLGKRALITSHKPEEGVTS